MNHLLPVVCLVFFSFIDADAGDDPRTLIMKKDAQLQEAIRVLNKNPTETGRMNIKRITSDIFGFTALGRSVVPKPVWDTAGQSMRDAFVSAFREMVEQSSMRKLEVYQADSSRYDTAIINGDKATVTAHLWNQGRENMLLYKMQRIDDRWKVVDLIINDLSTARSYREQFTVLFKNKDMPEVIEILKEKASSIDMDGKSGGNGD